MTPRRSVWALIVVGCAALLFCAYPLQGLAKNPPTHQQWRPGQGGGNWVGDPPGGGGSGGDGGDPDECGIYKAPPDGYTPIDYSGPGTDRTRRPVDIQPGWVELMTFLYWSGLVR